MFLLPFLLTLSLCLGLVVTLELNWDLDWVNRKPDGFERPVIGINGQWPLPKLDLQRGERLIVHVKNSLGNETASIHWHGLRQGGSATMDGPSGVNQCPIPPGETFTYDFTVKGNVGTYW